MDEVPFLKSSRGRPSGRGGAGLSLEGIVESCETKMEGTVLTFADVHFWRCLTPQTAVAKGRPGGKQRKLKMLNKNEMLLASETGEGWGRLKWLLNTYPQGIVNWWGIASTARHSPTEER